MAVAILSVAVSVLAQTPYLVKDMTTGAGTPGSYPDSFAVLGSTVFFSATVQGLGTELWISDGTAAGTRLLKDINPGSGSSFPQKFCAVGSTVFFSAYTPETGIELWKSDGTEAGTVLVKDLNPGSGNGNPVALTNVGGTLFFLAGNILSKSDGTAANTVSLPGIYAEYPYLGALGSSVYFMTGDGIYLALAKTDGTPAGTSVVKDFTPYFPLSGSGFANFANELYFAVDDGVSGKELWQTDGTTAGTVILKDINPGAASSNPANLTVAGGSLYFTADDGVHGTEIWETFGNTAGTFLLKDIVAGAGSSSPQSLFDAKLGANDLLYFSADDGTTGQELWRSNGGIRLGATARISDIEPGPVGSSPMSFFQLDPASQLVYFIARTSANGLELWVTDESSGNTALVKDINPGSANGWDSTPPVVLGTTAALFRADDGVYGFELWKTDGTAGGTILLKDCDASAPSSDIGPMVRSGANVFFANTDANGRELWKTNATFAGTGLVMDINPGPASSNPSSLADLNGTLLFNACTAANGCELWKSNGTSVGTTMVSDINAGTANSSPRFLANVGGTLYFAATEPTDGEELWKSDGSTAGTVLVSDIQPGVNGSSPHDFVRSPLPGKVVFRANEQPWTSDGSAAGTSRLANLVPLSPFPSGMTLSNGRVFFQAFDFDHGHELWATDGSPEGTLLVRDIRPGTQDSTPDHFVDGGSVVYFSASDGTHGSELWKSTGTSPGTEMVKDINPGSASSNIDGPVMAGATLYFVANDGVHGNELWKSDGTTAGTVMVADINPGPRSGVTLPLTEANGLVYFAANDGIHGSELWVSDGTVAGTQMVYDLNPGTASSDPRGATVSNGVLLFTAFEPVHGRELWAVAAPIVAPTNVVATAMTPFAVSVSWSPVGDAASYEVVRSTDGTTYTHRGTITSPAVTFSDDTDPYTAYLYEVRAYDGGGMPGPYSSPDLATTAFFTNDPLVPGVTTIKALHINQLQTAINAVRTLAQLPAGTYTSVTNGMKIGDVSLTDLRANLDPARSKLKLKSVSYTDSAITKGSTSIKAAHITELRNGVK